MTSQHPFRTGLDRLLDDPTALPVPNRRLGLLTNFTGVTAALGRNIDALRAAGFALTALFGPEHGLSGSAQAGGSEPDPRDPDTGIALYDTYGADHAALRSALRDSGVAALLVDLQDIGVRYYTYAWTVFDMMAACAREGVPIVVLDRPNPLSFLPAAGPGIAPDCLSFVGRAPIPIVHALTLGELARQFNAVEIPARHGCPAQLYVVRMVGWDPDALASETDRVWVAPSPNIPTFLSAVAYAATCLFEGTNASEGRGTTHPFETIGAGYVDGRYAEELRASGLPGVMFRDVRFLPTFGKWQGQRVRGVHVHVVAPREFDPVRTGLTMLQVMARLYPDDFSFHAAPDGGRAKPFLDLLWGSPTLRTHTAAPLEELLEMSPRPRQMDASLGLYPASGSTPRIGRTES